MEEKIITFSASEQGLQKTGGISHYASDTVSYVKAVFDLGENWQGFDEVRAVFKTSFDTRSAVLNSLGECEVPFEILMYKAVVRVNLVGSIITEEEVTDRLTTYSVEALTIDEDVPISGDSSVPITPSEYEQFVASVRNDADRAEAGATASEASASEASASADQATASAQASEASALRASGYASDAQTSERNASEYAQNAHISAQNAETWALDAEEAKRKILSMRATAETLAEGSQATASYSDGVLTLGIPRGDTGARGEKGETGETGATPNLTIGTVETLEPTESATATITGTAENPVLNLGIPQGRTGEVTYEDLESLLPKDTATGNPITITDGQSIIPVESLKVTLEPIQDLHGYDKPWAGGAGRNLLNVGGRVNQTSAEVRYTSDDNYIILNGTKNGGGYTTMGNLTLTLPAGTYYAKAFVISGTTTGTVDVYPNNGTADITGSLKDVERTITLESETTLRFRFAVWSDGTVLTNYTVGIVISKTSGIDKFYPYSNICPIDGWTDADTHITGVNVWDEEWEVGAYNSTNGDKITASGFIRCKNKIPVRPNTTYYYKQPSTYGEFGRFCFYDSDENFVGYDSGSRFVNSTLTTPSNAHYITFWVSGSTYNNDISINYPSTDTSYHAHDGDTYTTTLGRTVYGGTLDVVSGELVVDRAYAQLDTETTYRAGGQARFEDYWVVSVTSIPNISGNIKSDSSVISSTAPKDMTYNRATTSGFCKNIGSPYPIFALMDSDSGLDGSATLAQIQEAMNVLIHANPPQIVYELATPQTYQLDPQTISLLHGTNNVWSDGEVEMVYNADVQLWVLKQLGTSGTRTLSMTRTLAKSEDTDDTKSDNIQLAED